MVAYSPILPRPCCTLHRDLLFFNTPHSYNASSDSDHDTNALHVSTMKPSRKPIQRCNGFTSAASPFSDRSYNIVQRSCISQSSMDKASMAQCLTHSLSKRIKKKHRSSRGRGFSDDYIVEQVPVQELTPVGYDDWIPNCRKRVVRTCDNTFDSFKVRKRIPLKKGERLTCPKSGCVKGGSHYGITHFESETNTPYDCTVYNLSEKITPNTTQPFTHDSFHGMHDSSAQASPAFIPHRRSYMSSRKRFSAYRNVDCDPRNTTSNTLASGGGSNSEATCSLRSLNSFSYDCLDTSVREPTAFSLKKVNHRMNENDLVPYGPCCAMRTPSRFCRLLEVQCSLFSFFLILTLTGVMVHYVKVQRLALSTLQLTEDSETFNSHLPSQLLNAVHHHFLGTTPTWHGHARMSRLSLGQFLALDFLGKVYLECVSMSRDDPLRTCLSHNTTRAVNSFSQVARALRDPSCEPNSVHAKAYRLLSNVLVSILSKQSRCSCSLDKERLVKHCFQCFNRNNHEMKAVVNQLQYAVNRSLFLNPLIRNLISLHYSIGPKHRRCKQNYSELEHRYIYISHAVENSSALHQWTVDLEAFLHCLTSELNLRSFYTTAPHGEDTPQRYTLFLFHTKMFPFHDVMFQIQSNLPRNFISHKELSLYNDTRQLDSILKFARTSGALSEFHVLHKDDTNLSPSLIPYRWVDDVLQALSTDEVDSAMFQHTWCAKPLYYISHYTELLSTAWNTLVLRLSYIASKRRTFHFYSSWILSSFEIYLFTASAYLGLLPYKCLALLRYIWHGLVSKLFFHSCIQYLRSCVVGLSSSLSAALLIPSMTSTERTNKQAEYVKTVFLRTCGFVSPFSVVNAVLAYVFTSPWLYLIFFVLWLPSVLSPHPLTLVHFPRLMVYIIINCYRYLVLYKIPYFLQSILLNESLKLLLDFSDHIVLYMTVLLIVSIEVVAAERCFFSLNSLNKVYIPSLFLQYHSAGSPDIRQYIPMQNTCEEPSQGITERCSLLSSDALDEPLVSYSRNSAPSDAHDQTNQLHPCSHPQQYQMNVPSVSDRGYCRTNVDVQKSTIDVPPFVGLSTNVLQEIHRKHFSHLTGWWKHVYSTIIVLWTTEFVMCIKRISAYPKPLLFVYAYSFCIIISLYYMSFNTALFFHNPLETICGILVGFFGLYMPLWILLKCKFLSLNHLGILRYPCKPRRHTSFNLTEHTSSTFTPTIHLQKSFTI